MPKFHSKSRNLGSVGRFDIVYIVLNEFTTYRHESSLTDQCENDQLCNHSVLLYTSASIEYQVSNSTSDVISQISSATSTLSSTTSVQSRRYHNISGIILRSYSYSSNICTFYRVSKCINGYILLRHIAFLATSFTVLAAYT